ncbi:MAG: DUF2971 domain-containing protein [Desulfobacterales bacterium]|nr:DUF2971 domain-containing protein [Desulfobacterales bacterium]MDD4073751.1 DUF2971 domain-containing protein [Desulfobacterales bacterium]
MESTEYEIKISIMDQWADAVRAELVNLISKNPPQIIFHYTDIKGLIGTIESGCVWATHVSKLNDSSEYLLGIKIVKNFVQRNMPSSSRPLIEKALSEFKKVETYIACYSTEDDLLSQWRAYSGSSVGYSMGLATREMATLDDKLPPLEQVVYQKNVAESILGKLLKEIDNFLNKNTFGEVEVGYILGMLQATLNNVACIIKHHKFEEESEFRHIYQSGATSLNLETHFRHGNFGLTPYVKIHFLKEKRLPLKVVRIGPCKDPKTEIRTLKALLSKYGYEDVKIHPSEIPLRR